MELCVFYLLIFTSVSLIQLLEGEVLGFSIQVPGDLGGDTACFSQRGQWLGLLIYSLGGFAVRPSFGLSGMKKLEHNRLVSGNPTTL